jgi:O-antigen/teichoic acid export membrane protein
MHNPRSVLENVTWLQISSFITSLFSAVLGILVARYVGSYGYGIYSTSIVVTSIFSVFIDFGFSELMVREGARNPNKLNLYIGSALSAYSILFIVSYTLMIAFAFLSYDKREVIVLIAIYGVGAFFARGWRIWQGVFRIHQRQDVQAKLEIFAALLRGFLIVAFLILRMGLFELVLIHAITSIIVFALHTIIVVRIHRPIFLISEITKQLLPSLPFGMSIVFFMIYSQTNVFLLSLFTTPEIIGGFSAVYRLIIFAGEIPLIVFNNTLLPLMFKAYKDNPTQLKTIYLTSSKYMFGLGTLFTVFIVIFADSIVFRLYGETYGNAVNALRILSPCIALRYLSCGVEAALTAIDRMKEKVLIQAAVSVICVILNLILIPIYSMNGAAIATLISEAILLFLFLRKTKKYFYGLSINRDLALGNLAVGVAAIILVGFFGRRYLSDIFVLPILILISPLLLKISGFVDWHIENGRITIKHN